MAQVTSFLQPQPAECIQKPKHAVIKDFGVVGTRRKPTLQQPQPQSQQPQPQLQPQKRPHLDGPLEGVQEPPSKKARK